VAEHSSLLFIFEPCEKPAPAPWTPSGLPTSDPESANTEDSVRSIWDHNARHTCRTPRHACTGSVNYLDLLDAYSFAFTSRRRKLSLAACVWQSLSSADWNTD
jgi:hypothetical protein